MARAWAYVISFPGNNPPLPAATHQSSSEHACLLAFLGKGFSRNACLAWPHA